MSAAPLLMVSANQAWNLVNFREGLIRAWLAQGWRVMAVAPPDPVWEARLVAMGCSFAPLPLDAAGSRPDRELASLLHIWRLMRRHRPAAWLSWTIKPNTYGALAARTLGIPALPNVSGLGTAFIGESPLGRIARALYALAFRACPVVFFQNAQDRDLFVGQGLARADQARLLPGSGVDLHHFTPPEPMRRGDGPCHFLMIARLLGDKGVREFVEAARQLRGHVPPARFTLMGPVGVANRTAIARAELDGWLAEGLVEWRPAQDDVRPALAEADWVVLPSYREGLSRVLVEAAAMARPLIATDVPGCRDVVREGQNGFLARPRDAASLAQAMRRALALDDTDWNAMARASRAVAEAGFSIDSVILHYEQALQQANIVPHKSHIG